MEERLELPYGLLLTLLSETVDIRSCSGSDCEAKSLRTWHCGDCHVGLQIIALTRMASSQYLSIWDMIRSMRLKGDRLLSDEVDDIVLSLKRKVGRMHSCGLAPRYYFNMQRLH